MYTVSSTRKFLNQTNQLLTESNISVIDKFVELILEKIENINKDELEQVAFSLKDEINNDHISNVLQKKKKRDGPKRAPTAYNIFIKDTMSKLKNENPELKNKDLLGKAAKLWNEHKENKLKEENL